MSNFFLYRSLQQFLFLFSVKQQSRFIGFSECETEWFEQFEATFRQALYTPKLSHCIVGILHNAIGDLTRITPNNDFQIIMRAISKMCLQPNEGAIILEGDFGMPHGGPMEGSMPPMGPGMPEYGPMGGGMPPMGSGMPEYGPMGGGMPPMSQAMPEDPSVDGSMPPMGHSMPEDGPLAEGLPEDGPVDQDMPLPPMRGNQRPPPLDHSGPDDQQRPMVRPDPMMDCVHNNMKTCLLLAGSNITSDIRTFIMANGNMAEYQLCK